MSLSFLSLNTNCTHIWILNRVMWVLYIATIVTCIPMNLLIMHQLLFETIPHRIKAYYFLCLFMSDLYLIVLQFKFASLSKRIHKTYAKLSRIQWSLTGHPFHCMRTKLKLLMCFERLSHKTQIGIELASTTVTFPLLAQVISGSR